jgi:poly(A) polymerase
MAEGWWRIGPGLDKSAARALVYRLGAECYADRVLLAWSRSAGAFPDPRWPALLDVPREWRAPSFPLKAADFIARGVPRGPQLGTVLAQAEEAWVEAGFPLARDALDAIAAAVSASATG